MHNSQRKNYRIFLKKIQRLIKLIKGEKPAIISHSTLGCRDPLGSLAKQRNGKGFVQLDYSILFARSPSKPHWIQSFYKPNCIFIPYHWNGQI